MKKGFLVVGMGAALLVLVAALVVARPDAFSAPALAEDGRQEMEMVIAVEKVVNGVTTEGKVHVRFEDPGDLPAASPGEMGLFLDWEGDLITVGKGAIEVTVDVEVVNDQEPVETVKASHSGGEVLIRVTDATTYLADVTEMPVIGDADIAAGEIVVARVVRLGSLDEIGQPAMIRVWGVERDGEFLAETLVYEPIR